jgi:cephalosporin hydroxylase
LPTAGRLSISRASASLGKGRVIGVDIEIRKHNRAAIEAHPLSQLITMFEGSSIDPGIVQQVKSQIEPGATVMLILDSNHSRSHVAAELDAYASLVTPGSYILVQDGVMQMVAGMNEPGQIGITTIPLRQSMISCQNIPSFRYARRSDRLTKPLRRPIAATTHEDG